jgi:hypothetical protein
MLHTSLDLLICVEQPIEPVGPRRTVFVSLVVGWGWSEGSGLAAGAVWPVAVVVLGCSAWRTRSARLRRAARLVIRIRLRSSRRTLPTKRSAGRVGPPRPHRCLDDADVGGGEDGVEGGGELGVAVPDQKPELAPGVVEVHCQVAGLWGQPGAGGVGGDTEHVHPAGGVLDNEERVQPMQAD